MTEFENKNPKAATSTKKDEGRKAVTASEEVSEGAKKNDLSSGDEVGKKEVSLSSSVDEVKLSYDPTPFVWIAIFIIFGGLGGFIIWAWFSPLAEGIPAQGVVQVFSQRKVVQHLSGGIVDQILVKDGDMVKKGQTLLVLDDSEAKSRLGAVKAEYQSALILEARLLAERTMAPEMKVPEEIIECCMADSAILGTINVQKDLFRTRMEALQNEIEILNENIQGVKEYIKGLEDLQKSKQKQIDLLLEESKSLRELADQGYYPKNRLLDLDRAMADLSGSRSEELGNIARARKSLSEYRLKIINRKQEFMKEVDDRLTDVQRRIEGLKEQYVAAIETLERIAIDAPIDGMVMNLSIHTIGGVVSPRQPILEIVPENADLIVEAYIMPQNVDRAFVGQETDLRFTSFNARSTPVITGKIIFVSPDRMIDEARGVPYYLCKVRVSPKELQKLGENRLRPGMPVEVVVKSGLRSVWEYLVKPLTDRLALSLLEE